MKRLNLKFMALLIFIMPMVALGANELEKSPAESIEQQQDFVEQTYNMLINFAFDLTRELVSKSYGAISTIFNNVISVLLVLIACIWLFKQIKTGTLSKEELYKAMVWVIVFIIVYVLLNSYTAFSEFTQIFLIPQHLVSSTLSVSGGNTAQQLNSAFVKPFIILSQIPGVVIDYYIGQEAWYAVFDKLGALLMGVLSAGTTALIFLIYVICNLIVVIAVTIMHMYSIFLSGIYIAFLPLMIPLLLIPQTKNIFFAWVKSFIGITMYVPLSMIGVSIINKCANMIIQKAAYSTINVIHHIGLYTLLGIISCIIAILLIYKIPTWISELLGVANQGIGAGGALGMMKTAGMGLGAYGKGVASNILNSKSGGTGALRTLGNIATGGLGGVLSEGKTAVKKIAKGGFTAMANHFKGKNK